MNESMSLAMKALKETLLRIQASLHQALGDTKREIADIDAGKITSAWGALPSDYALDLARVLRKVEQQLYIYAEINSYNIYDMARTAQQAGRLDPDDSIAIQIHADRCVIRLPYLPERGKQRDCLVNDLLMSQLTITKGIPRWPACHLDIFHVFPTAVKNIPKDVDNYDYKRCIDILAFNLGFSDSAATFSLGLQTIFTDDLSPGVYLEITPKCSENAVLPHWAPNPDHQKNDHSGY
ncbi:MAG TPA: hypothetical protein IAC31_00110 [Candidatus Faecousia intestinigallinarum]|nr:hypothetical protein [Candidatus Faecousia intestinigallinarum]